MLDQALRKVAVLGAAGKMGSGISLLLLQEMLRLKAETKGGDFRLTLIDANEKALGGLHQYLKSQLVRYAEKQGISDSAPLIASAEEMVLFTIDSNEASQSHLVFEAIVEDIEIKAKVFSGIDSAANQKPFYFTNTSSIPIRVIDQQAKLGGRIIGFHFYNPPPVQRLLEIIPAQTTVPELNTYAKEVAARLGKITVFSKDVAGFIGNGHFMREIDYALKKVGELEKVHSREEAIWIVDRVTHDFLIRPMGIFQLLDYVGLDVGQKVFKIMNTYLEEDFDIGIVSRFLEQGIKGGQNPDGSQKDGIFKYEGSRIIGMWDGKALPDIEIGELPEGHAPWKVLSREKGKEEILKTYFGNLFAAETPGALLAQDFLIHSREIAQQLVKDGVAAKIEDVNTVLTKGFYHLYGADSPWIPVIRSR